MKELWQEILSLKGWVAQFVWFFLLDAALLILAWVFGKDRVELWRNRIIVGLALTLLSIMAVKVVAAIFQENRVTEERNRPNLQATITRMSVGQFVAKINQGFEQGDSEGTSLYAEVRVTNLGSPSITSDWKLKITTVGGEIIESSDLAKAPATLESVKGANPVRRGPSNFLPMQTYENPIPTGAAKSGWVSFLLKKEVYDEIKSLGTKFVISFKDVEGKEIYCEETMTQDFTSF